MKIAIIGISGTGKSTLARELQKRIGIAPLFADSYIWGPNWTLRDRTLAGQDMLNILQKRNDWIYDGYLSYIAEYVLTKSDIVIYFDYSGFAALHGVLKRWWIHRKIPRPEFALGCEETFHWNYFFNVVLLRKERRQIEELLQRYPPRKLYRLSSHRELKTFLDRDLKFSLANSLIKQH